MNLMPHGPNKNPSCCESNYWSAQSFALALSAVDVGQNGFGGLLLQTMYFWSLEKRATAAKGGKRLGPRTCN